MVGKKGGLLFGGFMRWGTHEWKWAGLVGKETTERLNLLDFYSGQGWLDQSNRTLL